MTLVLLLGFLTVTTFISVEGGLSGSGTHEGEVSLESSNEPSSESSLGPVTSPSLFEKAKRDFIASTRKDAEKYPFEAPVRKFMWQTAIQDGMQNPWWGVGWTPEVPSMVWPNAKNKKGALPSPEEGDYPELPVAGPHNSYLSIFARLGFVGVGLFFMAIFSLVPRLLRSMRRGLSLEESVIQLLIFSGLLYALFHSGLESPHNSLVLYLSWGIFSSRS